VSEDDRSALKASALLDFLGENCANSAESKMTELVTSNILEHWRTIVHFGAAGKFGSLSYDND
jgi:hypothetical protein